MQWKLKGGSKQEEIPLEYYALQISFLKPFPEYNKAKILNMVWKIKSFWSIITNFNSKDLLLEARTVEITASSRSR